MDWLLGPPRLAFCEPTLDGWIAHPADTWTNVALVIAAAAILRRARAPLTRLLGWATLWMGVVSAWFHASNTLLGETLDLSGMFLFVYTVGMLQLVGYGKWPAGRWNIPLVLALAAITTLLSLQSSWLATPLFAAMVVVISVLEILQGRLRGYAWGVGAAFALAWTFWWLDFLHILCWPQNHILTGHGVWHLLNGLVFWWTYKHFAPLHEAKAPPADTHA